MTDNEAKARIDKLSKYLIDCKKAYYIDDEPFISDAIYDSLLRELEGLEAKYPQYKWPNTPTEMVGYSAEQDYDGSV